ncbi:DNA-directed RNA polymerase subunit RPC12/RpoP [Rhizobium etli]|nr:DNA-directed RNA polymerase subunit RPC12/RpoP [Rhizobium etli]
MQRFCGNHIRKNKTLKQRINQDSKITPGSNQSAGHMVGYRLKPEPKMEPVAAREVDKQEDSVMAKCDQCGNDYDKAFQVNLGNETYTFDSFECAIQKLAPACPHCGVRIIGHGVEQGDIIYCCAHCAEQEGADALTDRAP